MMYSEAFGFTKGGLRGRGGGSLDFLIRFTLISRMVQISLKKAESLKEADTCMEDVSHVCHA